MSVELSLLEKLQKRSFFTPDYNDLRWKQEIAVFIYGNFKRKCNAHENIMGGSKYIGRACTLSTGYKMKDIIDNVVVFKEKSEMSGVINGEAYLVNPQHMLVLDQLEQNNVYMHRELTKILLKEQEDSILPDKQSYLKMKWIHAFMYVAIPEAWKNKQMTARVRRQNKVATAPYEQRPYYEFDYWEESWPDNSYDEWDFFHRGRERPFCH